MSVTRQRCAKAAAPIQVSFGVETPGNPKCTVFNGVPIFHGQGREGNSTRPLPDYFGYLLAVRTVHVLMYPVKISINACIDARFASQSAHYTPTGDAGQLPRLAIARLTHQRTTRVAGARVATAALVPGTYHVLLKTLSVPEGFAADRVRHYWNDHFV